MIPDEIGGYRKGLAPPGEEKSSALLSFSAAPTPILFPPLLSWTHYLILMRVENQQARAFYEIEAGRESWSTRELERQVAALLYERVADTAFSFA